MRDIDRFMAAGWATFGFDPEVRAWADSVLPAARLAARDPTQTHWLRCGGTWFVGVDALPNDERGAVGNGRPLTGAVMNFINDIPGFGLPLHKAQVSICYPGYPQPSEEETATAFQYRVKRDAAHVDGLLAEGPQKRRYLKEPHAYILGLPLADADSGASPLTVWEGSHVIMRRAFERAFDGVEPEQWRQVDVTDLYQAARRDVFSSCKRIELPASPGEAMLLHRHVLHGVAPWREGSKADADGRMIAYFRPEFPSVSDWLGRP
jgi:hypothetical protein